MRKYISAIVLCLAVGVWGDEKKETKVTTVREMILACPAEERGPDNGKGWQKLHYDRLKAWFADEWKGKEVVLEGLFESAKADKNNVAVITFTLPRSGIAFGMPVEKSQFLVTVSRENEADFLKAKKGQKIKIQAEITRTFIMYLDQEKSNRILVNLWADGGKLADVNP